MLLILLFRYLIENPDWLEENIGEEFDDDYILFDCPGDNDVSQHVYAVLFCTQLISQYNFQFNTLF